MPNLLLRYRNEIRRHPRLPLSCPQEPLVDTRMFSSRYSSLDTTLQAESGVFDDDVEVDDSQDGEEDAEDPLKEEFDSWTTALKKATKGLNKKQKSLESEWQKAQGVESTVARAQLIVSNLYMFTPRMTSATVQDWEQDGKDVELVLDPKYDSANDEAEALFAQARKLKRGSQVVGELLTQNRDAIETLQDAKMDLESALSEDGSIDEGRLRLIQDRLKRTSKVTNFQLPKAAETESSKKSDRRGKGTAAKRNNNVNMGDPASNLRKLKSPGGCSVIVGRNRRGNEHLSMNVAKGDDVWMHARGCPGAHVVLQIRRGGPQPTDECFSFAANLAAFYSDARNERKAEITCAEPKHVQKPRGAPLGAVKLREELYTLVGRPEDVPEELKQARDESGLTDEYHNKDKAKHRKRTQEVAKHNQAKRRAETRNKRKERRANRSAAAEELPDFF